MGEPYRRASVIAFQTLQKQQHAYMDPPIAISLWCVLSSYNICITPDLWNAMEGQITSSVPCNLILQTIFMIHANKRKISVPAEILKIILRILLRLINT